MNTKLMKFGLRVVYELKRDNGIRKIIIISVRDVEQLNNKL